ncbi:hypothetical protein ACB092_06G089900 [Castanea dentata]
MLSRAGKEILIKAVARSTPTYTMSVFQLPLKLYDELDAMCAKFWWVKWEKLTISKKDGGMSYRDLRAFNLAMLAKQGWRLLYDNNSLVYQCIKARYFPRTHLFDAKESLNCSIVWKSIVAALPILKLGCCWRVENGFSIRVLGDKWIPNYPTNAPLHLVKDEVQEVTVAELIDQDLHAMRFEFIMDMFEKEDVEAICRIQLSQRYVENTIIWLHHKKGEVLKGGNIAESSRTYAWRRVWTALWKFQIPNKIKLNLSKRRIIEDAMCPICLADMIHLMEYLLDRVESQDMEIMLVQAWLIWNQRNRVVHGGKFHDSGWLNNCARELLEEYWTAQEQMGTELMMQPNQDTWQLPPQSVFKLNFDAIVFSGLNRSGYGAVIRNEKGEVMAAKGPKVFCSEEAELLVCRKAIEFAADAGFSKLIIERDNNSAMKAISTLKDDHSMLGNVIEDIQHLLRY